MTSLLKAAMADAAARGFDPAAERSDRPANGVRKIPRSQIATDPRFQKREFRSGHATDLLEAAKENGLEALGPCEVFDCKDTGRVVLVDGFHRLWVADRLQAEEIPCIVHTGTEEEAELHACGANETHGLRRTHAERAEAIARVIALRPDWGDRRVAKACRCGASTVGRVRKQVAASQSSAMTLQPGDVVKLSSDVRDRDLHDDGTDEVAIAAGTELTVRYLRGYRVLAEHADGERYDLARSQVEKVRGPLPAPPKEKPEQTPQQVGEPTAATSQPATEIVPVPAIAPQPAREVVPPQPAPQPAIEPTPAPAIARHELPSAIAQFAADVLGSDAMRPDEMPDGLATPWQCDAVLVFAPADLKAWADKWTAEWTPGNFQRGLFVTPLDPREQWWWQLRDDAIAVLIPRGNVLTLDGLPACLVFFAEEHSHIETFLQCAPALGEPFLN